MADLALVKTSHGLQPATEADREFCQKWKVGQVLHGKITKMRNARFHGKFFAMLDLAFEYWEPKGGLIPRQELRGIQGFAEFLAEWASPETINNAANAYVQKLEAARAERFPVVDKSREAFRDFVTIEAGHFELAQTPAGIVRRRKSIAWSSMDDTEFEGLYRDVFNVCWRLVLSAHFDSEDDAMAAADMMGGFA